MRQAHNLPILIVVDHLLVREGLKQILSHEYRDVVFGEARTADEAVARIKAQPWRLVILDVSLSDNDGFFVLREIRTRRPEAAVLILSMHGDSVDAAHLRQLGARRFEGGMAAAVTDV